MSDEIKIALHQLNNLILPLEKWNSTSESPVTWLNNIIKDKLSLSSLDEKLITLSKPNLEDSADTSHDNSRWIYVKHCLECLDALKEMFIRAGFPLLKNGTKENTLEGNFVRPDFELSTSDTQIISNVVQSVIVLGVVPNLFPGVGLPIERRNKFYPILQDCMAAEVVDDDGFNIKIKMYDRILYLITKLLNLLNLGVFASIILTKHLGDLLAGLIQTAYAPIIKEDQIRVESNCGIPETIEDIQLKQQKVKEELYEILNQIRPPLVIRYLLVLQSSVPIQTSQSQNGHKNPDSGIQTITPKWLQDACGILLSHLIIQPCGVLNVIHGVLDIGRDVQGIQDGDIKKYTIIAAVISNPLSTSARYQELENYFSSVCPQILDVLNKSQDATYSETIEVRKKYGTIASICIRHLSERSSILSRRYLFDKIMEPLMRLCHSNLPLKEDRKNVVVEESELKNCIDQLYLIFFVSNEPLIMFIGILRPVILTLLYIHCKICFGESHLRHKVEKLVVRFLKYSSPSLSMKVLRRFTFNERTCKEGKKDEDNLMSANLDVLIAPGEHGGIIALKENFSMEDDECSVAYSSPSFYVADDEKSIAIVDLLEYIKSKDMTIQFYLNLLQDLTVMMDEEEPSMDKISAQESEVIDIEHSDSKQTLKNLLEMECELDETMCKIRKRLMVIRLIGLMSEDDALKTALMQNAGKMIEFLLCTIHRAAQLCKKREMRNTKSELEQLGKDDDVSKIAKETPYEITSNEMQSLTTALTLLRNLVVGGNNNGFKYTTKIKDSDWDILQLGLEDLEVLENCHSENSISLVAGKLRQLISSHIAVMEHTKKIRCNTDQIKKKTEELHSKLTEFKSLCSQSSSKNAEVNTNTQNVDGKGETSTGIPVVDHLQCENQIEEMTAQRTEETKILSLKCLALNAIKDPKCPSGSTYEN